MGHGIVSVFSDSIASGASTSGGIDLARSWDKVSVVVGTMSTAAAINVYGSVTGTTYYQVFSTQANTSTVANNAFVIASGVGTNGGIVQVPGGLKFMKFAATAVVSGGVSFKIICSD